MRPDRRWCCEPGTSARATRTRSPCGEVVDGCRRPWGERRAGTTGTTRARPHEAQLAPARHRQGAARGSAGVPALGASPRPSPRTAALVPGLHAGDAVPSVLRAITLAADPRVPASRERSPGKELSADAAEILRSRFAGDLRRLPSATPRPRAGSCPASRGPLRRPRVRRGGARQPRRGAARLLAHRRPLARRGSSAELAAWYGVSHAPARQLRLLGQPARVRGADQRTCSASGGSGRGDEVITVAAGFPTTVAPIVQYGAGAGLRRRRRCRTYNIDVAQLEAALSPRTRAVMLAHTLGNPFDLDAVARLLRAPRPLAHRGQLRRRSARATAGRKTGTFGDLATLSFYPPHHMTMGEGGAVYTERRRRSSGR